MADTEKQGEQVWEDVKSWLGKELVLGSGVAGIDQVERSTIRRQLEVLELDCPIHYDEEAAKKAGYPGIVAPYHMLDTFSRPANWEPGMMTLWPSHDPNYTMRGRERQDSLNVPLPSTHGFATDVEVEYLKPLEVGDQVIMTSSKLISVVYRETSVGEGAFLTHEQRYENQRGELLAIARRGGYRYFPWKKKLARE